MKSKIRRKFSYFALTLAMLLSLLPATPAMAAANPKAGFGGAMKFDGTNYVRILAQSSQNVTTTFTVEMWIKKTATSGGQADNASYAFSRNGGSGQWAVLSYANYFTFFVGGDSTIHAGNNSKITVNDTAWHHIAYAYNGSVLSFYLDGVKVGQYVYTFALPTNATYFCIGNAVNFANPAHDTLDEVRVWETCRTQDEIQSTMYHEVSPADSAYASLVFCCGFEEGSGSAVTEAVTASSGVVLNSVGSSVSGNWVASDIRTWVTTEDTALTGYLIGSDADDNSGLTYEIVSNSSKGTASIGSGNQFIYMPNANASGTDSFTYTVKDSSGAESNVQTVNITITPVNDVPVFVGGVTTMTVNQNAAATDIRDLLHVSDPDSGQTLTWMQSAAPSHGTLSFSGATATSGGSDITPGGTITYTSTAGYSGSDSFTVRASDGTASVTRTIGVTVVGAPSITGISPASGSIAGGTIVTITGSNFTDATAVKFDSMNAASYTVNSAAQITAVSPGGGAGTVDITVTTAAGTSTAGEASRFTYTAAPGLTGPMAMSLTEGYSTTSTGTYTVTGTEPVTVSKTSGDAKITWNSSTKKLDIATGLTAGSYPVELKASNGTLPDATLTFTLTVDAATITEARVTGIAAPAAGAAPATAGSLTAGAGTYTVTGLAWKDSDGTTPATLTAGGKLKAGTLYKAVIELTSATGNKFQAGGFMPTVDAGTAGAGTVSGGDVSGNKLIFTVTFPATEAETVTGIEITTQPTKLSYTEGTDGELALNGMVVTETNNDGTKAIVTFTDGAAPGYTTNPTNGTALTNAAHNGTKVTVTHTASGLTEQTGKLTVNVPALSGTATIAGSAVFGQTLTASLAEGNNTGILSYQWTRNGSDIGSATNDTYTLVEDDVGKAIAVKIASSVEIGTLTSAPTAAIEKADCATDTGATPGLSAKTPTSITVTAVAGYEYTLVTDGALVTTGTWQDSNVFAGLSANTAYDIYQRVKDTTTHKASAVSDKLDVTTDPSAEELANAAIAAAKGLLPGSFTAVEGANTNLLTYLNTLSGMNDTGVTLTLASSNGNVANDGVITYTGSETTGNVTVHINKANGTEDTKTIAVTIPAHTPTAVTLLSATADGAADTTTSTKIDLTFDTAITGLTASDITITNGSGAVVKGALTGSGTNWSIALTSVTTQGNVTVAVAAPTGYTISGSPQTVTVYKAVALTPVTLQAAVADGAADTTTSTKIDLTFDTAIAGLTASDITITDGTGAAVKGALTGSGTSWSIALTSVATQGNVTVTVSAPSGYTISGSPKTVAVYKAVVSTVTVTSVTVAPPTVSVQKGTTQTFTAAVNGTNSPAQTVTWSVYGNTSGSTTINASSLLTVAADETAVTLTVTATSTVDNSKSGTATVTVTTTPPAFVAVIDITSVPATATTGTPLTLTGTVAPADATNQTVVWSVYNAGDTGASIVGDILSTTAAGVAVVRATVTNGLTASSDYAQDFNITVNAAPMTTYTVTFSSNGGTYATKTVNAGESIGSAAWPAEPTRSSYTFGGWFTGENGTGTAFTSATPVNAAMTVYAKWTHRGGGGENNDRGPVKPTEKTITVTETSGSLFSGSTGKISASANMDNAFSNSVEVKVADTDEDNASFQLGAGDEVYPFDISLYMKGTNTKTAPAPGYAVTISLPVPENLLDKKELLDIVHKSDGGKVSTLASRLEQRNGVWYLVFEATEFSPYALVVRRAGSYDESAGVPYYLNANGNKVFIGLAANGKYIAPEDVIVSVMQNGKGFTDVPGHWAAGYIGFVTEREIFAGTVGNTFSPDGGMTRAMFATVIGRLYERSYGEIKPSEERVFTDCDYGAYYGKYIAWAAKNGIIGGSGNGRFGPDDQITREQMAALLYRFAGFLDVLPSVMDTVLAYPDAGSISDYAKPAALYCQTTGIIGGRTGGMFAPQETATRAEAAITIQKFVEEVIR